MQIQVGTSEALEDWLKLRERLWPEEIDTLRGDAIESLKRPDMLILLARDQSGTVIGFAEAAIRSDYVNGCVTSPVGFLEGIYVEPGLRLKGVARALCAAAAEWARSCGCSEMASDALIDNDGSHRMHKALGFQETERVVCFRKLLA